MLRARAMGRSLLWVGVTGAVALVAWFSLRGHREASPERYRTEPVDRGAIIMTVTATGTLSAVTTVQVGSQVSGIIARLHADFNSPVRKGQPLAELDPAPFEARVEQRLADLAQAEVQMRNGEIQFRRQERLLREGLTSPAEFDVVQANYEAARAQVDQARASLRQAETDLKYTKILSPIDGVIVDRQYDTGQTVAASFQAPTLFTIAQDLTKMQVQADVDQSDIGRVRVGQTTRFTVDAYPEDEFQGEITQIRLNATVNQNVITYPVILQVENRENKLRPKMTANVSIEVERVHGVLRIPNAALRFRPTEGQEPAAGSGSRPGRAAGDSFERRAARIGEGGALADMARQLEGAPERSRPGPGRQQTAYLLDSGDRLRPVVLRTGTSDGRYTAVLDGSLRIGDRVVVGPVTSKAEQKARPFGPRMF
jgi:HlyD family secretion protein